MPFHQRQQLTGAWIKTSHIEAIDGKVGPALQGTYLSGFQITVNNTFLTQVAGDAVYNLIQ